MTTKFKPNLGKKEIVNNIKSVVGFSTNNIQGITQYLIDTIISILIEKKKINIKNFGSFNLVFKKQRVGRNPKTKQEFTINSRNTIKFSVSKSLKQKINET